MPGWLPLFILWSVIGFLAQFVDGSLGMGFGVFSTTLIIFTGIAPALASASVHTAEIATTLFSGGSHLAFGNVKKEWLFRLIVSGVAGADAGALALTAIPVAAGRLLIAFVLLVLGTFITFRFARPKQAVFEPVPDGVSPAGPVSTIRMPLFSFIAAFIDATGGGGWGSIATTGLLMDGNADEVCKIVGTVNVVEFFISVAASVTFLIRIGWDTFNWTLVGALALGGVIAAPIAARVCKMLPSRLFGVVIGLVIVGINLLTIIVAV